MKIVCPTCNTSYKIPADRIPSGKRGVATCKRCGGKIVIEPKSVKSISEFSGGLAGFRNYDNLTGFINKDGDVVIDPQFRSIVCPGFKNGLCQVKSKGKWGYINTSGEYVWKEQ